MTYISILSEYLSEKAAEEKEEIEGTKDMCIRREYLCGKPDKYLLRVFPNRRDGRTECSGEPSEFGKRGKGSFKANHIQPFMVMQKGN